MTLRSTAITKFNQKKKEKKKKKKKKKKNGKKLIGLIKTGDSEMQHEKTRLIFDYFDDKPVAAALL